MHVQRVVRSMWYVVCSVWYVVCMCSVWYDNLYLRAVFHDAPTEERWQQHITLSTVPIMPWPLTGLASRFYTRVTFQGDGLGATVGVWPYERTYIQSPPPLPPSVHWSLLAPLNPLTQLSFRWTLPCATGRSLAIGILHVVTPWCAVNQRRRRRTAHCVMCPAHDSLANRMRAHSPHACSKQSGWPPHGPMHAPHPKWAPDCRRACM